MQVYQNPSAAYYHSRWRVHRPNERDSISSDNVDFRVKPDLNLGQATQFGFSKAQTKWVAVIDSDIVLRKDWLAQNAIESLREILRNEDS
jgi:glycosyltransferase involved in cell wall biosynthesis